MGMDRREPVLLPAESATTVNEANPQATGQSKVFKVRFLLHEPGKRRTRKSFSLYGKGEIRFGENDVTMSGKRHRLFWFGAREEHSLERERILDASATKKYVKFKVDNHLYDPLEVYFVADDPQQAQQILSLLPARQTEEFAQDSAERSAFAQSLDVLSPNSFVVYGLVAANILVFIAMAWGGAGFFMPKADVAINWGTNFGPRTLTGEWWRLLTATFIHFGVIHLAFNMLALYQTGRTVERLFGSLHFLLLYVVAGLSGSIVSLLWHPDVNSAGASGAIFGVFGGLLAFVLNPKNGVPKSIMAEHRTGTLVFIAYNLLNGFSHAGIDNGAHIGGLIGGFVMGLLLARPLNDTRQQGAFRRILAAGAIGLAGLAFASYPLYRPDSALRQDLAFQLELNAFGKKEQKALDDLKTLLAKTKSGTVPEAEIAPAIEQDILPQWNAMSQAMTAIRLAESSKWLNLQKALLHYIDSRRTAYQLMVDGQRNHDQEAFAKAENLNKDINAQIALMKRLAQAI